MLAALAGSGGLAQQPDPLGSAGCAKALDALRAEEDLALLPPPAGTSSDESARRAVRGRITVLRRQAAAVCLGGQPGPQPPSPRFAQPPISVVPPVVAPPVRSPAAPVGPLKPSTRLGPAPTIVSCDPLGCWASDGSRLPRVGPSLVGPSGLCSALGTSLNCP
ncbi:hypothetical protein [Rivibacter subsaxonicus]|uniref:hypothetical protein n=1 Tax=Rivibacter subsaxonicus TaxID=457575 RepID=UPI00102ABC20|nr:hypothetical protein [Rivibacter subsaxonicus]